MKHEREEPTPSQAGKPEQTQAPHQRGEGIRGVPPPAGEQSQPQQERGEAQPVPDVWDVLERKARRFDNVSRMTVEERERKDGELGRLREEIEERGSARDKHILALLYIRKPRLSLLSEHQQIQEWRSEVEQLSDEEIAECARKQREEIAAFRRGEIPIMSFHPSAGDGELILARHIAKKGKKG